MGGAVVSRSLVVLVASLSLALVGAGCLAPPNVCRGDPGGVTPTADEVCDHLASLSCLAGPIPEYLDGGPEVGPIELRFDAAGASLSTVHARECRAGYAAWESSVGPARFPALVRCYRAARNCEEVEACNRGCPLAGEDASGEDASGGDASRDGDAGTPDVVDASEPMDAG